MHQFGKQADYFCSMANYIYNDDPADRYCACCRKAAMLLLAPEDDLEIMMLGHAVIRYSSRVIESADRITFYHLDSDRSNAVRWNLVQLCKSCAQHTDTFELHKPLLLDPPTWLMPHAAGWIETHRDTIHLPATYDLRRWIKLYQSAATPREPQGRPWPYDWAPSPIKDRNRLMHSRLLHKDHWTRHDKRWFGPLGGACRYPALIPTSKEAQDDDPRRRKTPGRKTAIGGDPQQPPTAAA